ncbi:chromosome-associated kinesin KIF4 [Scomber japonicus]|uniref:chromosome-associated kinesin KIF4 n=1 Tax=Scomber japonicus TaxID=13676 RepID=UPI002306CB6E|nr:chromosome-associated kinesin KIF4 [Scomber japonicus]
MNAPLFEGGETVRVGVVLTTVPEGKNCVVTGEDGHTVTYISGNDEEKKSFLFDQVVTDDSIQPLTESISSGYNGALLICGASTERMSTLIDQSIIKQFHPDGSAVDLLSSSRQTLKLVMHPVLGSLIGGLSEVCVDSAQEAYTLYETCRETLKASAGSISSRCSSLFLVTVERKYHPEEVESEVCRSRLQLFSLTGGVGRTDLRGVSPLMKVVDQIQHEATTTDKLLPFLLNDALTGNSKTVLIYCIHPQDDETPSALAFAQKVSSLVTKAAIGCWCPKATEQEIRGCIMDVRNAMMSQGENAVHNTYRLAELVQNLQIVKDQSWEKRREKSQKMKDKIKVLTDSFQSLNSNWHFTGDHSVNHGESTDALKYLQEQLRQEMEDHIKEGKGNVEKVQDRVTRINQLRETLEEETAKNGAAAEKSDLCHQFNDQSQLEYSKALERRRQLKEDHGRLIQEEVETMQRDLAQQQLPTEDPQRELRVLTRERRVLVLQIEALRAEAQQAERDLQDQYHKHQAELHCLREESLQVFSVFRQVCEEQRKMSEGRYRSVLLEAVQDAVYLSAQNQQLQADNKQLHKALGELKDALAVRGDPKA